MADFTDPRVTEKRFLAILPQALTANGTIDGVITISNTYCFKVGQIVTVVSSTSQPRRLKVKAVTSETELKVGPIDQPIYRFSDVSDLLVADTAMIELIDDSINSGSQASNRRPVIDLHEIQRQVYEEEPTVALRTHSVDWLGRSYSNTNPLSVGLSFIRDNLPQDVIEDTVTPANNRPLPVKLTGFAGDISFAVDNLNLETQLEGVYNSPDNENPDNVGLIAHERNATPDDTHQTQRLTSTPGSVDTTDRSLDTALHDGDGNRISGTDYGTSKRVIDTAPFGLSISRNKIPGFEAVKIYGRNDDIDIANIEDVRAFGGNLNFPSSASTLSIVSDNAADDGLSALSGARTIFIEGLDSNYDEISETITTDGTTPVVTTNSYLRVNNAEVITAGTSDSNIGTITCTHGAETMFTILPEANRAFLGLYTVPDGKTLYIDLMFGSVTPQTATNGVKEGELILFASNGESNVLIEVFSLGITSRASAPFALPFNRPFIISERSDVKIRFRTNDNNTRVTAGVNALLETN